MWYFTDVHGDRQLFDATMRQIGNDNFIFGGDACDRRDDGYYIMKTLLSNPHCIYLKGNHEDMFVKAAREVSRLATTQNLEMILHSLYLEKDVFYNYLDNGGLKTLCDWYYDGMPMDFVEAINNLTVRTTYKQYDFCHAGTYIQRWNKWDECDVNNALWGRKHFQCGWFDNRVLIHGHTPVDCMPSKWRANIAPVLYCGGTKLNMDGGTWRTKQLFLLNLDDWVFYRFYEGKVTQIQPLRRDKCYYNTNNELVIPSNN